MILCVLDNATKKYKQSYHSEPKLHADSINRIRPNYRPCPYNRPPDFLLFFTYYLPLDDLLAQVVENKFTKAPRVPIRSNTVNIILIVILTPFLGSEYCAFSLFPLLLKNPRKPVPFSFSTFLIAV